MSGKCLEAAEAFCNQTTVVLGGIFIGLAVLSAAFAVRSSYKYFTGAPAQERNIATMFFKVDRPCGRKASGSGVEEPLVAAEFKSTL